MSTKRVALVQGDINFSCSALQRLQAKCTRDQARCDRKSKQAWTPGQRTARPSTARQAGLRNQRWNGIPELLPPEALQSRPLSKHARPPSSKNATRPSTAQCMAQLYQVEDRLRAARCKNPAVTIRLALRKLAPTNTSAARALEAVENSTFRDGRTYADAGAELVDEITRIGSNRMFTDAPRPPPSVPALSPNYKTSSSVHGQPQRQGASHNPSPAHSARFYRKKSRPVTVDANGEVGSWPFETNWPVHWPTPPAAAVTTRP